MSDYLPLTALIAPAVAIGVSALAVIAYEIEPRLTVPNFSDSTGGLAVTAIAAIGTLIAVRIVVARSQPITTRGLVAVDDAVRTQAVHTLAGAGIAIAFAGTASCLFTMGGFASFTWLRDLGEFGGFGALAAALMAWTLIGAAWRVQRTTLR